MLAAIDWNEVLMKAQMGAVLGAIGGACAGLVAYLTHKPDAQKQAELEARERARIHAQMHGKSGTAKTTSRWPLLLAILAILALIVASVLVLNPSLVAPLLPVRGGTSGSSKPSATITDYGRYLNGKGPIRAAADRNASNGVSGVSDKDVIPMEQTDLIPCQVGETWGLRIRSSDVPTNRPYTVRKEIHHPPIKQPDGSVRTKDVGEFTVPPGALFDAFCGWCFLKGYEYELVVGEWTIVVLIDDVEVVRKVFKVQK